ncbi:hypothetical protein PGB90_004611 [Kerria lacca]
MAVPRFYISQKIFAKVIRNYPPWPAKIHDFHLINRKFYYLIYLYGFNLYTKCNGNKLLDYDKYISKNAHRLSVQLTFAKAFENMIHDTNFLLDEIQLDSILNLKTRNNRSIQMNNHLIGESLNIPKLQQSKMKKLNNGSFTSLLAELEIKLKKLYNNSCKDDFKKESLFKTEIKLLICDLKIKYSLNLSRAKSEECLIIMDEILKLRLNALILKRHPQIVETMLNLRKYVGNLKKWKLKPKDKNIFIKNAAKIRSKAYKICNFFKKLLNNPVEVSFLDLYPTKY